MTEFFDLSHYKGNNKFHLLPFRFARIPNEDDVLITNDVGEYLFLNNSDFTKLSNNEMLEVCKLHNMEVDINSNTGQILDSIMSELVEPKLINPTFVLDYPKSISPLAKLKRDGSKDIVERFELFIGGSEFANSFSELNDPIDQRSRLEEQSKLRDQGDDEAQPIDEDFINAMEIGMPPTGGVGIGIDRLVMLLTNNRWIRDVILFPTMKPEKN